ncbi:MAG: thymidylate synthase [Acidimicrobiales bacterium]|nr:thymidylate synthase [Acidimicrobiales bacterium]RZV47081.1 MAG: thymidylate synthase [Acidimicrobiales bacterium]
MTPYDAEDFSPAEADILRRYFSNLDQPVFALVNLPEVVKGALFARYSRTHKSLRRLFLEEFVDDLDVSGDETIDATIGLRRAEDLYDKVFFQYGDDSVAQLGGVHLACEQASNVLTKILEWGRIMSYLEQSTRYIRYDERLGGRYRFYRDEDVLNSVHGTRYVGDMDRLFDIYSSLIDPMEAFYREAIPQKSGDVDFAYRQAIRAKALDSIRGILPAASLSNVGIYGSGQAYEALLLRMRSSNLPEARLYSDLMMRELRKVIPSFLKRVDLPDRGVVTSEYLASNREAVDEIAGQLLDVSAPDQQETLVDLVDFDPDAEVKLVTAMLYPSTSLSERSIVSQVQAMGTDERLSIMKAYVGDRTNRRHRPGRALERIDYRFDVLSDYGAFRDLQRHRLLTIEWQRLSTRHGYVMPEAVDVAGFTDRFDEAMARSSELYDVLIDDFPEQASYAVALAYRVRYSMQMNVRSAMHVLELRSAVQGHPAYRLVAQEMHRQIGERAGHKAVAEMMKFVDHSTEQKLERLDAENRTAERTNPT